LLGSAPLEVDGRRAVAVPRVIDDTNQGRPLANDGEKREEKILALWGDSG